MSDRGRPTQTNIYTGENTVLNHRGEWVPAFAKAYRQDRANGRPPWWRWFEPPKWWPGWLHRATCTYCRGMRRYAASLPCDNRKED